MKNPVYPCLWFDGQAKAAAEFYCSVFKNSKITADTPMVVTFDLNGRKIMCLNGGPHFSFNEAVSLVVECEDQHEIDYYWEKLLSGGGKESMCGWLKDKYGLSWQIIPHNIGALLNDPQKGGRAVQAMLQMKKLDIEKLKNA